MRKYKITGTLNSYISWKDGYVETEKTTYARFKWTMAIKVFVMRLLYDWVEMEELQ